MGVCGGLGQHFGIDPTFVRIGFVALALMGGPGILAYFILSLLIPSPKALPAAAHWQLSDRY